MKLIPGIKYLRGPDGFIYAFNEIKARRADMVSFVAEVDEEQPVTPVVEKKKAQKERVRKAKEKAKNQPKKAKGKAAAKPVAKNKETPVTAEDMRPGINLG